MQIDEEMQRLKDLYEELWQDGKTLIKDMSESIDMYRLAGVLLLGLSAIVVIYIIPVYLVLIWTGGMSIFFYAALLSTIFFVAFFVFLGVRVLRWYFKLKKRYAKLLQLEKDVED